MIYFCFNFTYKLGAEKFQKTGYGDDWATLIFLGKISAEETLSNVRQLVYSRPSRIFASEASIYFNSQISSDIFQTKYVPIFPRIQTLNTRVVLSFQYCIMYLLLDTKCPYLKKKTVCPHKMIISWALQSGIELVRCTAMQLYEPYQEWTQVCRIGDSGKDFAL